MDETAASSDIGSSIPLPAGLEEVISILIICFVFGGFGGLVAHFINNERASIENTNAGSASASAPELYLFPSLLKSICIGVAGALGFLFFMVAVGGITSPFQGLTDYLRVISTSVIAGFGARRLLSRMVDHLEQKIADAQSTADAAILETQENEERLDLLETNMKLLEAADGPSTQATRDDAIERGEKLVSEGRANAITWIHLSRVYRWNDNLDSAIDTLDKFIPLARAGKFSQTSLNPAYYNRGCYHALLYKNAKDEGRLTKCLTDLNSALETCSDRVKEIALIWNDDDWNHLANEQSFTDIVGQKD